MMSSLSLLSRREREVMEILYALGEATLSDVASRMTDPPTRPAMRSILTILLQKGHLTQGGKRGREFLFRPKREPAREGRAAWRRVLTTFFGGSIRDGLAAYLADPSVKVAPEELKEIESLIREARRRSAKSSKS